MLHVTAITNLPSLLYWFVCCSQYGVTRKTWCWKWVGFTSISIAWWRRIHKKKKM